MQKAMLGALAVVATLSAADTPPTAATDVLNADMMAILQKAPPEGVMDQQVRVVDVGKVNIGIGIVRRTASTATTGTVMHDQVTEIYQIIEGSGTLTTGGTLIDPERRPADGRTVTVLTGPSMGGGGIHNGVHRKIAAGDVVIIPPNVPHVWSAIDHHVTYTVVRVDADHVLPAGYRNASLKQ